MTNDHPLAEARSFQGTWKKATLEHDLERWRAFLEQHGVPSSIDRPTRDLVERMVATGSPHARRAVELRLSKLASDALALRGDARVVCVHASTGAWHVLSPSERQALEREGHRFETGAPDAWKALATIPITVGAYVLGYQLCHRAGLHETYAWGLAIAVYVLTARLVRGRWPLQR
jgi:hypothetical protein